ncbi:MAG: HIT domain-containing protein [Sulfolobales archaeon]
MKYITKQQDRTCIFCDARGKSDEESYVIFRGSNAFIMLNIFPYNTAHVMVAPYRHVNSFELLSDEELLDLMRLIKLSIKAIELEYRPQGFNIGANLGHVAGAGVEGHLHLHIVPRWLGDTNFMPLIANVKVIPEDIKETYSRLKKAISESIK